MADDSDSRDAAVGRAAGAALLAQQAVSMLIALGHSDLLATLKAEAAAAVPFAVQDDLSLDLDKVAEAAQGWIGSLVMAAQVKSALRAMARS